MTKTGMTERWDRKHGHTLREEKAQEAVDSACPELWGLLSSHMLEPRLTSESSEKNDRPLIHNVA